MDNEKSVFTRFEEWQNLMQEYDDFFYEDDGIYTASLIDKELKLYNLDFDRIKNLIQKLKDFEKKYGELYKDEKENLLKRKDILLDLKTQTNGIDEVYRKMSNMYEFIEDYWKYLGDLKITRGRYILNNLFMEVDKIW